ncbi:MAG: DUF2914 domain-containing protein [Thiomicrorhabdus chilensis]|uniref:DUF2914 domain-containing protein n=1 Tax=Thiomicrorhabdus chilensis TaxID=63656 RepID=UPI00299E99FB|nr:DUF2914 domain-containing protein [Thiomicrorhabdus chilensis]MDX1347793.1 DUF2914 domain-containing protein [Thiomicrorhabdus chilensis]
MRLPDTQNAKELHAFKKGYRLATENKTLNNLPSEIRYDRALREFSQLGWDQAQEEIAAGLEASQQVPWRQRLAWLIMMLLGGIVTATVLINNIKEEKREQAALIAQQTQQAEVTRELPLAEPMKRPQGQIAAIENEEGADTTEDFSSAALALPKETIEADEPISEKPSAETAELGLLTPAQRKDLVLNQQERAASNPDKAPLSAVIDSPIKIEKAVLTSAIQNKEATDTFSDYVPKNRRKLYFFTQIKGAAQQTIYHRWLFNQQVMALIPLQINSNLYRTWSSKRLTSAWQGQWTLEVLDAEKRVIYRQSFKYGKR